MKRDSIRRRSTLLTLLTAGFLLSFSVNSADAAPVQWRTDLKAAAQEAERTGKPILIGITADWCHYCHKMLRETFSDKQLATKINDCFIPVVLDADENEQIVEAIGIDAFPTSVIVSPELDVIGRIRGFHKAESFEQKLKPFCPQKKQKKPLKLTDATASSRPANRSETVATAQKQALPLAFDGLCLVSMLNERNLARGRPEFVHDFRGQRLQFATNEHLQQFKATPELFWPLADGNCPVATVLNGKPTSGSPDSAAVYRGQLIFFNDAPSRNRFAENPRAFIRRLSEQRREQN